MILSFKCADTQELAAGGRVARFRAIERQAVRKLYLMHLAQSVSDLRIPPGNRLEKLRGARSGRWSIRINDQWRVCFEWKDGDDGASHVEIVDYH